MLFINVTHWEFSACGIFYSPPAPGTPRVTHRALWGLGELHGNETVAARCGSGLSRGLQSSWLSPWSHSVLTRQKLGVLETWASAVTCSPGGLSQDPHPTNNTLILQQDCWDVF